MYLKIASASLLILASSITSGFSQELTKLNVLTPLPRHTAWYPLIVAEQLGYFADEGIEVVLIDGGDLPATAFLENGQVDIASLDPSEVILAHARGFDFDVVYEVMHGAVEGIFVLADNPATKLADLRGTTIGIVGESDRGLLLSALGHAGLSEADVTVAVLGESAPLLANSLRTGAISGLVGAVSDFVAMRAQGIEMNNLLPPEMSEQPANNYSVRSDNIGVGFKGEGILQGFFRAWAKGSYAGSVDLETTKAMAMQVDPENWVNEELGMIFLEAAQGLHSPAADVYGDLRSKVWEAVIAEMVVVGQIDAPFDTSEILNGAYVGGANSFDRSAVEADVAAWRKENM